MRPAEEIKKLFAQSSLTVNETVNERILDDSFIELEKSTKQRPVNPNIWRISMKNKITKLVAAAVIIVAAVIGLSQFGSTFESVALADISKAFSQAENVHIHFVRVYPEPNTVGHLLYWFRGSHYRHESYGYMNGVREDFETIVDNGIERLTLYPPELAQLSEPMSYDWEYDLTLKLIHSLKDKDIASKVFEVSHLPSESNDIVTVYRIDMFDNNRVNNGRMWVDAKTLLPQRISCVIGPHEHIVNRNWIDIDHSVEAMEIRFSYDPVPGELLSTEIPEGFTELPRLESFMLSGTVIDENGYPVEGAMVYGTCHSSDPKERIQTSVTDANGDFVLRAVINERYYYLVLPGFLRAFNPDDTTQVAWVVLEDPNLRELRSEFGGQIPGDPGDLKFMTNLVKWNGRWRGADRIVLQMEPASTLTGIVTDEHGKPLPDVDVWLGFELTGEDGNKLTDKEGDTSYYMSLYRKLRFCGPELKTDDQGRYVMANLPRFWKNCYHGPYFGKEGYQFVSSDKLNRDGPLQNQTVNAQMRKEVEKDVTINGRAIDNHGKSLAVYQVNSNASGGAVTDQEGYFTFKCVEFEDLTITVGGEHAPRMPDFDYTQCRKRDDVEPFIWYPRTQVKVDYQPSRKQYHVILVPKRGDITFEITAVDSKNMPILGIPVDVWAYEDGSGTRVFSDFTNADGKCTAKYLPGNMSLRVYFQGNNGYEDAKEDIKLIPGQKEYKIKKTLLTKEEVRRRSEGK
ncbi:MAG: carboxypeptidase regulatory-like domain-containing protein [Planctomycetota bacterium]|jgi:protocatechuate 3,4-dioxygenase beta subunit